MRYDAGDRVMTVWGGQYGSGYLIAPRLVLTAAHVVAGGPHVQVQPLDAESTGQAGGTDTSWLPCEVVWRRDDDTVDAALLRVTADPRRTPVVGDVQRWGRLTGGDRGEPWQAIGFPDIAPVVAGRRDCEHLSGTINLGGRRRGRRYAAVIDGNAPGDLGDSPWSGTSGAALFCGDLLTGVIIVDPAHWRHGRVEAVPVELLAADPEFRRLVEEASGTPLTVESVELAPLLAPHLPYRPVTPLGLLRADAETVPFHGREDLLAEGEEWCTARPAGAEDVSLLLLTGAGGQGKTRFARELTRRMRAHGWIAGLLAETTPTERTLRALTRSQAPVLLAVDYAEGRSGALGALLAALAERRGGRALRLLLLARGSGEWWGTLRARHPTAAELARPARTLPALDPTDGQADVHRAAVVDAFAAALSRLDQYEGTEWAPLAEALHGPADHEEGGMCTPTALERHRDLLVALLQSGPEPVPERAGAGHGTEAALLDHEWRYGDRVAAARGLTLSERARRRAVVVACLVRPAGESDALTALRAMQGLRDQSEDRLLEVAGWLAALYPPGDAALAWDSPRPDRLAEHHVAETVRVFPDLLDTFLPALPARLSYQALIALGRGWQQEPDLGESVTRLIAAHGPRLGPVAVAAVSELTDPAPVVRAVDLLLTPAKLPHDMLVAMLHVMPEHSEALRRAALHIAYVLVKGLMKELSDGSGEEDRGELLSDLVVALEQLTWRLTQGGVARARQDTENTDHLFQLLQGVAATLVREQGEEHTPCLVTALSLSALNLADTGRAQEALPLADEAVRTGRTALDAQDGLSRLLGALNTRALVLGRLGRHDEAVASLEEIGEHLKDPEARISAVQSYGWQGNLASELDLAGRPEEAAEVFDRTLPRARQRARSVPDSGRAELGSVLTQAAEVRMRAGQPAAALTLIEEALGCLRPLARRTPEPYARHVVRLLEMTATCTREAGDSGAAAEALAEAEQWCRARAPHDATIRPRLVEVLRKLTAVRRGRGEYRLALRAANGAVQILLDLAEEPDGQGGPDELFDALLELEKAFDAFGAPGRALSTLDRATELYDAGARSTARPGLDRSDLLNRRGNRRAAHGDREGGLADVAEAVRLRREVAGHVPDGRLRLALSLSDLACRHLPDRAAQGLAPAREAVRILRDEAVHGRATALDLNNAVVNLVGLLLATGHPAQALEVVDDALNAGQSPPNTERAALLWALRAEALTGPHRPEERASAARRAVDLYATHARQADAPSTENPRGPALAFVCLGEALLVLARASDDVDQERLREAVGVLAGALRLTLHTGMTDLAARAVSALRSVEAPASAPGKGDGTG
ncbi:trypsin-like peptidase domain-containing protein [Streptomyces sp. NPDC102406]|uniref:trypsin-like peptidase domain-containing protein n=1 Tax=Streptomyces sp. NPDC102406 TaxID=3366171 RepID=UPI00381A3AEE